jgi:hypothetical protein
MMFISTHLIGSLDQIVQSAFTRVDALRDRFWTSGDVVELRLVAASVGVDADLLRKFADLRDAGIISDDEFDAKKAKLLE